MLRSLMQDYGPTSNLVAVTDVCPRLNTIGRVMTGCVLFLTSPHQGLLWWGAGAEGADLKRIPT